ncbi:MAG TPA: hypothetical protein VHH15_01020 [Actinophytocola sp.]|nr:hypothetical protein [Actinophytocola sp.]
MDTLSIRELPSAAAWTVLRPQLAGQHVAGRVSDPPYPLPLARHYAGAPPAAHRSAYDQFLFESSRPGGLAVDGLPHCTRSLRESNADALVVSVDQLGDDTVWVGGERWDQWHLVGTDESLRTLGVPVSSRRADEALPRAALAIGAEVIVTAEPLPLADGVGVLLRHP